MPTKDTKIYASANYVHFLKCADWGESFGTLALVKGMPIESVSKILGHTKITTTQIYAKITTEKLEHDISAFGKKLEAGLAVKPGKKERIAER